MRKRMKKTFCFFFKKKTFFFIFRVGLINFLKEIVNNFEKKSNAPEFF
jgi:hypothetical protein